MEAVEFLINYNRMCSTIDKCSECPAVNMKCCELSTDEQAKLVEIVEKWAKEHPEEPAAATTHKNDEPCVKTIQNELEGAIYQTLKNYENHFAEIKSVEDLEENCYRNFQFIENRHIETCKEIVRLKDRVAELEVALKAEPVPAPEPKRTNKDVLLAAFPDAHMDNNGIPNVCPFELDEHHPCSSLMGCSECRYAHWLAEVEE